MFLFLISADFMVKLLKIILRYYTQIVLSLIKVWPNGDAKPLKIFVSKLLNRILRYCTLIVIRYIFLYNDQLNITTYKSSLNNLLT